MPYFRTPDGLSLYFSDEGTGLPIVCLAGLTRNSADFEYVSPHLTGCRLIKLDYRGRGRSDCDTNYLNYSIAIEAQDVLALLDYLELDRVAILGTSRGGLIAMCLGAIANQRLLGVALNDIGPVLEPEGLENILDYLGRNPEWKTYDEAARMRPLTMPGFENVPKQRWLAEIKKLYRETPNGLEITYDPKLRDAVLDAMAQPSSDAWQLFEQLIDKPMAVIRGANSDLLSTATVAKMQSYKPDLILTAIAGRGHVPFLDEPEAIKALRSWIEQIKHAVSVP
ncbi:MAG: alpha/beta hydrolase [Aestuariivita sp.]|nr:alpha/beta hydrolase [Aestuariivita sp.]MCY4345998.1 alpha/beta hydrolase [Aestuariivita sp.]